MKILRRYYRIQKISFIILLTGLTASCEKADMNSNLDEFNFIRYGTSFGECIGYCKRSIEVSTSKIHFEKIGWDQNGKLPDVTFSEEISEASWNDLVESIDFEVFLQLDSIIGCPDCADGGAEWIEIEKNDTSYKVTFEFGNEPESVKSYIVFLRTSLDSFD
jgi:hypothetical protein